MSSNQPTTTAPTVQVGAMIFENGSYRTQTRRVVADPTEAIVLDDGEFIAESYNGYRTICRLTGRTRRVYGLACPTLIRFDIETIANDEGVILGVKGAKLPGTWAVRPEYVG